ncbi:hypothetical protein P775_10280 [Puniceibacterium antarcticum]|uniref:CENP-V/GFA domain-containing protein n=1 Tax=Puniceibacterium antarcticum TaxID=1206336 RepID=A0A2G8RFI3_9RHOB|nr:GFA family protein [Puniceibacterium antarcticum]PIL20327.1 hypothetical protein P775_10280 [Puniceibacterium antarcticum]
MIHGSCACGAITFTTSARPAGLSVCHCVQCRKMSGHFWASAQVPESALTITGPVSWYRNSPRARRGLCPTCGAFLFWQGKGESEISFALGALDDASGLHLEKHIFTAEKGDYYSITDELPQKE